ncbi:hypothetical protein CDL12_19246 [Handroanthus impetiginosus]|uniref:SHSP domain-containing protein n=1 Tax=Handroanthus impetiginosus TaxID=429701 RepID=A0A2G9GSB7_9LAMI|nr:hypothetical protein CDL12_19246 [Handroanthus impetiginosus]
MEGKANRALTYEEFEPFCKWHRKENEDIVEIHLPEFKKEQFKVQISNSGILKISGERPLDASRNIKFYKRIEISSNYDSSAIRARLEKGKLYITLPKGKNLVPQSPNPEPIRDQSTAPPPSGSAVKDQIQTPGGISCAMCELPRWRRSALSFRLAKVAVTVAVMAAAAALVAYVVYVNRSKVTEVDDMFIS